MQTVMNSIQEFDGINQEATIPWLDHIEGVAKKMGFDPVEIGMSKLKGMALCDVNAASKEGILSYFWFCQLLIEHYLNIPYMLDTLNAYAHLVQGEHKSTAWYLTRAKVLLECIHHNSKMCDIPGIGYDKFYLARGLHSPHAQQRVASEQDTWHSMENVFQTIEHVTRSEEQNRAFFNPNLEVLKPAIQVKEVSHSKATQ